MNFYSWNVMCKLNLLLCLAADKTELTSAVCGSWLVCTTLKTNSSITSIWLYCIAVYLYFPSFLKSALVAFDQLFSIIENAILCWHRYHFWCDQCVCVTTLCMLHYWVSRYLFVANFNSLKDRRDRLSPYFFPKYLQTGFLSPSPSTLPWHFHHFQSTLFHISSSPNLMNHI